MLPQQDSIVESARKVGVSRREAMRFDDDLAAFADHVAGLVRCRKYSEAISAVETLQGELEDVERSCVQPSPR